AGRGSQPPTAPAHRQKLTPEATAKGQEARTGQPSGPSIKQQRDRESARGDAPALLLRRRRLRRSYGKDRVARPAVRSRIGSAATEQRDDASCRHGPVQPPV